MAVWDDILTERDKLVFRQGMSGGKRRGFGFWPALLVVDVTYAFVGYEPQPILESIKTFRTSCGEEGWQGISQIQRLLTQARAKNVPIVYTHSGYRYGPGTTKGESHWAEGGAEAEAFRTIVREVAPEEGDIVIGKPKASAFFGTPLVGYLVHLGVDTLLVTGCTTSGCVRATVVDGHSHNLRVSVVEECVWDRVQASHKASLFDMNAKYADVVSLTDALGYLDKVEPRPFPQGRE